MEECRLIYKSVSTEDVVSNQTLADIIDKGSANNRTLGITGLLVLSGNEFLQVLEGDPSVVNNLYLKIAKDARHTQVQLISYESVANRFFETWNMRLVDLWDLSGKTRDYLKSKYRCEGDMIQIPGTSMEIHSLLLDAKSFCLTEPWK